MRYSAIAIDPPWPFRVWSKATGSGRSAESHYPTMTWPELRSLGSLIDLVAAPDCALFLWACRPSQDEAIDMVVSSWNEGLPASRRWAYKTEAFTWVKRTKKGHPSIGLGYWTRANTEPVLLFTRGKVRRLVKNVPQVVETVGRPRHSEKPAEVYDRIERLVAGPYLEVFARQPRAGWSVMGNEIDGRDIREALADEAGRPAELKVA